MKGIVIIITVEGRQAQASRGIDRSDWEGSMDSALLNQISRVQARHSRGELGCPVDRRLIRSIELASLTANGCEFVLGPFANVL